ncbi:AIR synthase-related protein, partial [Kocuria subflava]
EVCERDGLDLFTMLFSETQGRAVVAVPRSEEVRFKDMCTMRNYPFARIGVVDAVNDALDLMGATRVPLPGLRQAHESTLPTYFG